MIHDELGQSLTSLKMDLRWLERRLSEPGLPAALTPLVDRVVAASGLTAATIVTVQKIAAELRPGSLDHLGLAAALTHELRRLQARGDLRCTAQVTEPVPALPAPVASELFYICQEALTNVVRHARATAVEVSLQAAAGSVVLEIKDDGVGTGPVDFGALHSLGLLGMRERAAQCGGTVTLTPNEPNGTRVTVRIPHPLLPGAGRAGA